jgi:hypothetical protein
MVVDSFLVGLSPRASRGSAFTSLGSAGLLRFDHQLAELPSPA